MCRESFAKGNAATPEGKTVYDGIEPEDFLCRDCPIRISGPLDGTSALSMQVWNAVTSLPEGTASVEFVFSLFGIPSPSRHSAEVYHRVCLIGQISHEIAAKRAKQPVSSPHTQDLLAGLVDDEDE